MDKPGTHKLSEAMQGQKPADATASVAPESGQPSATPREVAEETRRQQEARSDGRPDRDDRLTHVGRGQQTHG